VSNGECARSSVGKKGTGARRGKERCAVGPPKNRPMYNWGECKSVEGNVPKKVKTDLGDSSLVSEKGRIREKKMDNERRGIKNFVRGVHQRHKRQREPRKGRTPSHSRGGGKTAAGLLSKLPARSPMGQRAEYGCGQKPNLCPKKKNGCVGVGPGK